MGYKYPLNIKMYYTDNSLLFAEGIQNTAIFHANP